MFWSTSQRQNRSIPRLMERFKFGLFFLFALRDFRLLNIPRLAFIVHPTLKTNRILIISMNNINSSGAIAFECWACGNKFYELHIGFYVLSRSALQIELPTLNWTKYHYSNNRSHFWNAWICEISKMAGIGSKTNKPTYPTVSDWSCISWVFHWLILLCEYKMNKIEIPSNLVGIWNALDYINSAKNVSMLNVESFAKFN